MSARGQANLLALAAALVVVTAVTGVAVGVADDAFGDAQREVDDRRVAGAVADRLVSGDGPLAVRENVLNGSAVDRVDAARLREQVPALADRDLRVRLDDRTLARAGDPSGGATVRRIVLVQRRSAQTVSPPLRNVTDPTVALPRRTPRVDLAIDSPSGTTVRTVRANGRVVLHDPGGLDGEYTVRVSRYETTRLTVEATDPLPDGTLAVTYYPARTSKALLEVTVGA